MAHIESIAVGGYKCLDRVEIAPLGQVNILAGRNNVGKSTVLQMLLALPTLDDLVAQFAPRHEKKQSELPSQGYREKETPWFRMTTVLDHEEHVQIVGRFAKVDPPKPDTSGGSADKFREVVESGLFRSLTWVWNADRQGHFLLVEIIDEGDHAPSCQIKVSGEKMSAMPCDAIWEYVRKDGRGPFLAWLKGGNAGIAPGLAAPSLAGNEHLPKLNPHWLEVQSFLGRPRFFLQAQRRAQSVAVGARTMRLDGDGTNLLKRLETVRNNNTAEFNEICRFMEDLIPGIGNLVMPYIDEEGGQRFQLEWENAYGRIPLSESGTGIEQLLMLGTVLFAENRGSVIMLEEPENHLHPGAQERLLRILHDRLGNGCAFITTHSPVLVQPQKGTVVVSLRKSAGGLACGTSIEGSQAAEVLRELGVKAGHFLLADVLVLVEGITGATVVEEWVKWWKPLKDIRDEVRIVVHSFNAEEAGSKEFDVGRLYLLNRNVIFVADRDENEDTGAENPARRALSEKCQSHNPSIPCVILKTARSLERLFPERAIREAYPPAMLEGWAYDPAGGLSPFQSLHEHVAASQKRRGISEGRLKNYNGAVAEKMTHEDLEAIPDAARILQTITDQAKSVAQADGNAPA